MCRLRGVVVRRGSRVGSICVSDGGVCEGDGGRWWCLKWWVSVGGRRAVAVWQWVARGGSRAHGNRVESIDRRNLELPEKSQPEKVSGGGATGGAVAVPAAGDHGGEERNIEEWL
ncbi:hypothetical protein Tco_1494196 [Tanacetum coccineum]